MLSLRQGSAQAARHQHGNATANGESVHMVSTIRHDLIVAGISTLGIPCPASAQQPLHFDAGVRVPSENAV
jgi:hypothetical protein